MKMTLSRNYQAVIFFLTKAKLIGFLPLIFLTKLVKYRKYISVSSYYCYLFTYIILHLSRRIKDTRLQDCV